MSRSRILLLGAALMAFAGAASAETLGEALATGRISDQAAVQLVAGSGLSFSEAQGLTVNEIAQAKWKDD
ncbi:hypothetical protein CNY89_09485 [Amaricoccus sp. HAR-UPW-R2A-40]|nr:hypothetical protein CNY89_09485 [Amaricoccus sp. HAR-UPW-R2A-40]